jgi:hypothetical protein
VNGSKFLILIADQKDGNISVISGFYYPDLGTGVCMVYFRRGEILVLIWIWN